ncbi:GNAT family N-acetyltransferase [Paenisporosarcina cavernae]|uniref:N-acetyltransferase n=1 Tax=Paenisporosarcina cavernae TaxID=2320858 RepID=A0A385YYD3_9BACL|nr:GNAT family protein [Paenisporosarcina cavernae]AYC30553.1 N-acetyltransferase [Paenisporosarcina cavernae]
MEFSNDRILLREMTKSDWFDVHKYASQDLVSQYQPWGPNTEEDSINFVNQVIRDARQVPRKRFVFAMIYKENMIGAGEFKIRDFRNKAGEIAYIVNPDYWGKGFATEVATLLIEFGFDVLKLHRIYATCDPRNIASTKVLEKVGMVKEGQIREDLMIKDGWRDSLMYSILEHEWR